MPITDRVRDDQRHRGFVLHFLNVKLGLINTRLSTRLISPFCNACAYLTNFAFPKLLVVGLGREGRSLGAAL